MVCSRGPGINTQASKISSLTTCRDSCVCPRMICICHLLSLPLAKRDAGSFQARAFLFSCTSSGMRGSQRKNDRCGSKCWLQVLVHLDIRTALSNYLFPNCCQAIIILVIFLTANLHNFATSTKVCPARTGMGTEKGQPAQRIKCPSRTIE